MKKEELATRPQIEVLKKIFNLKEIRGSAIVKGIHPSKVTYIKTGTKTKLTQEQFLKFKVELNKLYLAIARATKLETNSDQFLKAILELSSISCLNWSEVMRKVNATPKPHPSRLRSSYHPDLSLNNILIEYPLFFKGLKKSLKALAGQIKID